jgi:hypothetical protein
MDRLSLFSTPLKSRRTVTLSSSKKENWNVFFVNLDKSYIQYSETKIFIMLIYNSCELSKYKSLYSHLAQETRKKIFSFCGVK